VEGERPEAERSGFLPPKPPGPEPELGERPAPAEPSQQGGWQPPAGAEPSAGWQPQPDNGPAVTGFVLSLVAGGLLFVSAGLSSIVSVGCAIFGVVHSRRGRQKVAAGETTKHAGLAQAGWIIGIVSLVLSVLATLAWLAVLIAALTDEDFRDDLEREFDDSESVTAAAVATLRIAGAAGRSLLV
jgi:hypothetical protein